MKKKLALLTLTLAAVAGLYKKFRGAGSNEWARKHPATENPQ